MSFSERPKIFIKWYNMVVEIILRNRIFILEVAMYKYKLNNSYTVYVFPLKPQSPNKRRVPSVSTVRKPVAPTPPPKRSETVINRSVLTLKNGTLLYHKTYGFGSVESTDSNGYMYVRFLDRTAKFIYPDAILNGFLTRA